MVPATPETMLVSMVCAVVPGELKPNVHANRLPLKAILMSEAHATAEGQADIQSLCYHRGYVSVCDLGYLWGPC